MRASIKCEILNNSLGINLFEKCSIARRYGGGEKVIKNPSPTEAINPISPIMIKN